MESKELEVGDRVRLKKGLLIGEVYGGLTLYPSMKFKGTKEIIEIVLSGDYTLDDDFTYSSKMLERAD